MWGITVDSISKSPEGLSELERAIEISKIVSNDNIVVDEFDMLSGNYDGCRFPIERAHAEDVCDFESFRNHLNNM